MNYNYIKTEKWINVRPIIHGIPEKGTWVTIRIGSILTDLSTVMIRTMCQNNIVDSFCFRNSKIVMCNLEDIKKWLEKKVDV